MDAEDVRVDGDGKTILRQRISGFVSPTTSLKVGQGRFFLSSTGKLVLAAAGNLRVTVQNPAGSNKIINIVRVSGMATGTGWAEILLNPTSGLPTATKRPAMNAVAGGGLAPVAVLRNDTDTTVPLSGGADTGLVLGIPANARFSLDMPPLILAPGATIGLNVPFAGAAEAAMSLYWFED